jgi:alpha-ketoglutarate-dependent taurine dioxygenase
MPQTIKLFRVLLAAPLDVTEEQESVAELIDEWNVQHGDTAEARIELMNWRTHAHPEAGKRAQALINRQFADRADIVLANFWRRFGSPTGKAASGTVEEIERAQRRHKKVMVYFSQRLGSETEPSDSREQNRIEKFKRRFGRNALYKTYTDGQEFETAVRKDLALVMAEVVATARKKR